ncbi:Hypothetical protein SRAE_0000067850 [Strongyloides ratti]|uniref:Uncharacterized protein n=1 Tax=Strongyloides ratti TaxID=34506 RepID=A0A090MTA9_STRRB|nr:Hypothetical protein SRAE_0000067850 [Strongyloides ratti]CEF61558.1 Hypothetical protein SRAE_0000067850 [Strongyloides ratti]
MSDDRFARQDRFELPSEFLLTSPCTSIVHHLSGRTTMAITAKNDYIIYLRFSCANDNKIKRSEIKIIFITPLILTISMTCHSNTLLGPATGSVCFHRIGFTSSLTLSPEYFAIFLHSTCSLSDS